MNDRPRALRRHPRLNRPMPWRHHATARAVALLLACGGMAPAGAQTSTTPLAIASGTSVTNTQTIRPTAAAAGSYPGKADNGADGADYDSYDKKTGNGAPGETGKAGGLGGNGAGGTTAASGSSFTLINYGSLIGGKGGDGGQGGTGGNGGDGGLSQRSKTGACPKSNATCADGAAGGGGHGGQGGNGGVGGTAVSGSHFKLINYGTVRGGQGGESGAGGSGGGQGAWPNYGASPGLAGADGLAGDGGVGVVATGFSTIINLGLIAGRAGIDNGSGIVSADGHAIDFSGGANRLVLKNTDYAASISGKVVSTSGRANGGDTLELDLAGDAAFSLNRLRTGFIGFAELQKSGVSVLTLNALNSPNGVDSFAGRTLLTEGALVVNAAVSLYGDSGSDGAQSFGRGNPGGAGTVAVTVSSGTSAVGWGGPIYTPNASQSRLVNAGLLKGGDGGAGSRGVPSSGAGGQGASAVTGYDFMLTNDAGGRIVGGDGGRSGDTFPFQTYAAGGVAISVTGKTTIVNAGTVAGGMGGSGGSVQAHAINLAGGGNSLSLRSGSDIQGLVVSAGGDTLDLGGSAAGSFNASLIGSQYQGFSQFTKSGSANWTLTGSGATNWLVQAGTLTGTTSSMAGNLSFGTGSSPTPLIVFDQASQGSYGGHITGDGRVTVSGGGQVTFTGANSYTGITVVSAGQLALSGAGSFGSGVLQVNAGAAADISAISAASTTVAALQGRGTLALGGKNLRVDGSAVTSFAGTITGAGSLTKAGSGVLTLAAANTYSGGTQLQGGLLIIGADAALGAASGGLSLNGATLQTTASFSSARQVALGNYGGTVNPDTGSTLTLSGVISGSGILTQQGGGTLVLSGANSFAGMRVAAGTLSISSDANLGTGNGVLELQGGRLHITGNVVSARTLSLMNVLPNHVDIDAGATLSLSASIQGRGTLVKSGDGFLMLQGDNSGAGQLGGLVVKQGAVVVSQDSALGQVSGGLTLDGGALITSSFATSRTVTLGAAGGRIVPFVSTLQLDGAVTGSGSLTTGGGNAVLILNSKLNNYGGDTTVIEGGTLRVAAGSGLGNDSHALRLQGGQLALAAGASTAVGSVSISHDRAWVGSLRIGEAGNAQASTLQVRGNLDNAGNLRVDNGLLAVAGSLVNTGTLTVLAGGRVNAGSFVQTAGSTTLNGGLIDPPTTITISGGTLAGSGTLEGDVQVSGGRVEVGADGLLVTGAYAQTGGTLDFGLSYSGGQYHYGRLTASTLALGGTLEFTLSGASAADLQRLQTDLLANLLQPLGTLGSPSIVASFSSIRLDSTLAGVEAVMLGAGQVAQLDRAFTTAVPEPAHWALMLAGLAGLAGWTRRQRAGRAGA